MEICLLSKRSLFHKSKEYVTNLSRSFLWRSFSKEFQNKIEYKDMFLYMGCAWFKNCNVEISFIKFKRSFLFSYSSDIVEKMFCFRYTLQQSKKMFRIYFELFAYSSWINLITISSWKCKQVLKMICVMDLVQHLSI